MTFSDYGPYKFIEKLKNAPALKYLIMDDLKVSVQDMETIYAYCPKLSVLKIKHGLGNISQVPTNIKPASSTKTLSFEFAYQTSVDRIIKWLKYFGQKYNRVTHLTLNSTYEDHRFEDKGAAQIAKDGFKPLLKDFAPRLVSFETPIFVPRFDKLKPLTLKNSVDFEANLVFGNTQLGYLEITAKDEFSEDGNEEPRVHFLFMTTDDATIRLYWIGQPMGSKSYYGSSKLNDTNVIYPFTRPLDDAFTDEAYITVVLGSVNTLVLNDYFVYNVPMMKHPHEEEEDSEREETVKEIGEADVDDMSLSVLKKIRNLMKQFHGEENAFKDLLERRRAEMEE